MLSAAAPAEVARYLRTGDEKSLAKLPGIGKKSAARLVVELGQRVPGGTGRRRAAGGDAARGGGAGLGDALAVLGAMGLPPARAEAALLKAREADPDVERTDRALGARRPARAVRPAARGPREGSRWTTRG